ncbi:hypothetical protein SEA_VINCENZO_48 [Mycobacterium phage Vincenzo]|uniref:Uncharacterized protein n=2 Tax=Coopervirus vincenzo TaxID=1983110 RepID=A0A0F6WDR9_9CAUD|nr:hypothetical protein SEA_VINCENZO_48 [Mycobacterium phage Vincenzo]AKF14310.1 hypothetical protein SEA_VINCENZO_48 [Mycobacterium phage Vincenzo]AKF14714.1 hypothetical protein SEA_ALANGRANT_49 [Mycobacterium phage AlanGrant]
MRRGRAVTALAAPQLAKRQPPASPELIAQAVDMAARGLTPGQIARKLRRDPSTVRGWLRRSA